MWVKRKSFGFQFEALARIFCAKCLTLRNGLTNRSAPREPPATTDGNRVLDGKRVLEPLDPEARMTRLTARGQVGDQRLP
jgi:hypothetical protein